MGTNAVRKNKHFVLSWNQVYLFECSFFRFVGKTNAEGGVPPQIGLQALASRMDQSRLLSLLGAELKKMELSSTMIFLLTDSKMLLSSSKPIMIATRGMPGIPLNRESESVEDVHRVLRALPLFREMEGILRERNLNLPSVQEISAFRVNLFSGIRRESAIADYDAFWRSLLEEIHTPQGRSCFGQRIQDLHARMSAEGNWDYLIAQQGRGYFGNLPNLNSPLDQYQFGIHPILDLNIGEYYVSFTNLSLSMSMLLTLGLVLLLTKVFMESSGQKRGRAHAVVEASSSASATPNSEDDDKRKKVSRQDANGKESEPPINGAQPEVPSIAFLKKRIKTVLRSCRDRNPRESTLRSTYEDLHLETASAEKRVKIAQALENLYRRSQYFRSNKRQQPHTDLIIQICDWERTKR
nr:hypothetical protein [Zea mays]